MKIKAYQWFRNWHITWLNLQQGWFGLWVGSDIQCTGNALSRDKGSSEHALASWVMMPWHRYITWLNLETVHAAMWKYLCYGCAAHWTLQFAQIVNFPGIISGWKCLHASILHCNYVDIHLYCNTIVNLLRCYHHYHSPQVCLVPCLKRVAVVIEIHWFNLITSPWGVGVLFILPLLFIITTIICIVMFDNTNSPLVYPVWKWWRS